jgi:2-keto-3-deoxy-L-rhamnonate aldolase RhmA
MSLPRNIPELARPEGIGADSEDLARAIEDAAEMVQAFVEQNSPAALDSLLETAGDGPDGRAKGAANLAEALTAQTVTLHEEVRRFLSLAPPK